MVCLDYKKSKTLISLALIVGNSVFYLSFLLTENRLGNFLYLPVVLFFLIRFVLSLLQNKHAGKHGQELPYPHWYDLF